MAKVFNEIEFLLRIGGSEPIVIKFDGTVKRIIDSILASLLSVSLVNGYKTLLLFSLTLLIYDIWYTRTKGRRYYKLYDLIHHLDVEYQAHIAALVRKVITKLGLPLNQIDTMDEAIEVIGPVDKFLLIKESLPVIGNDFLSKKSLLYQLLFVVEK